MADMTGWWWGRNPHIELWIKCKDEKLHSIYDFQTEEELLVAMKYPKEYKTEEEYQRSYDILSNKGVHDPYFGY